jgi:hypothetical protein
MIAIHAAHRRYRIMTLLLSEFPKDFLAGLATIAMDSGLIDHNREARSRTGSDMSLEPLAKRFLTMMAAGWRADRCGRVGTTAAGRFAKLMQFARTEITDATWTDGILPGPAGHQRVLAN